MIYLPKPIKNHNLIKHVPSDTFQKGIVYFKANQIKYVERFLEREFPTLELYKAKIVGTQDYNTYLLKEKDSILAYYCPCACSFLCKHVIALSNHISSNNHPLKLKKKKICLDDVKDALDVITQVNHALHSSENWLTKEHLSHAKKIYKFIELNYLPDDLAIEVQHIYNLISPNSLYDNRKNR